MVITEIANAAATRTIFHSRLQCNFPKLLCCYYFQDTGEVINFGTKLWSIENEGNEGNDNPKWLHDIQETFCEIVKEIDTSDIIITEKEQ